MATCVDHGESRHTSVHTAIRTQGHAYSVPPGKLTLAFTGSPSGAGAAHAILEGESRQAAWRQCEAYLLVLTQEAEFPLTFAMHEFQLMEKSAGITDLCPVMDLFT